MNTNTKAASTRVPPRAQCRIGGSVATGADAGHSRISPKRVAFFCGLLQAHGAVSSKPSRRRTIWAAMVVTTMTTTACLHIPKDLDKSSSMPSAPATAGELLDRHVRALGGIQKIRALRERSVDARIVFRPEQGCAEGDQSCVNEERSGTFTLYNTADGRLYRRTVVNDMLEERGFDGKMGWQFRAGQLVLDAPEDIAVSREDAVMHWYLDPQARKVRMAIERSRTSDSDGKPRVLDGLRWEQADAGAPAKTLWFDRRTGLLHEEITEDGEGDDKLRQIIVSEDYRPIDGVLVAHKIRLLNQAGRRTQEIEFSTQRVHHGHVDAKLFAIPKPVTPEKLADNRLDTLAQARSKALAEPKDVGSMVAYARAAWSAAHFDEAKTAAEATLKHDGKEPEALWILARVHELAGQWDKAEPLLDKASKQGVKPEWIALHRAWMASHRGDFSAMASALDAANASAMAGRYRSFVGKPVQVRMPGNACAVQVGLVAADPVPVLEVELRGEKVRAMVDTGAGDVILESKLAERLEIPIQSRSPLGERGPEIGHGQLDEFSLAGMRVSNVPADVFPTETLQQMAGSSLQDVRMVIGVRVLERFQTTFDRTGKTIAMVERSRRCSKQAKARRTGKRVPFWLHATHFLYVLGDINGAEGLFLLNTGMRGAALTASQAAFARAGVGAPPVRRGDPAMVTLESVGLADALRLTRANAAYGYFDQDATEDGFRVDGMMGLDVFSGSTWTLDFDEHAIFVTPAIPAAHTKPAANSG